MQKRAALARALVTDPSLVLFDEPTTGQDPIRKNAILGMVAEYQNRFGFTALLISHEIPDVYFISNRILALYGRKIVFQGTPDEFEEFEHPFREEILTSLESLQEDITGLYSKRHFKVRYQTDLSKRHPDAMYAVAAFAVDDLDMMPPRKSSAPWALTSTSILVPSGDFPHGRPLMNTPPCCPTRIWMRPSASWRTLKKIFVNMVCPILSP
jgi:ABC-type multidrug transport system ATPase subunit